MEGNRGRDGVLVLTLPHGVRDLEIWGRIHLTCPVSGSLQKSFLFCNLPPCPAPPEIGLGWGVLGGEIAEHCMGGREGA